jgi:arginase
VRTISTTQWIGATRKGIGIGAGSRLLADALVSLGVDLHERIGGEAPDETRDRDIVGRSTLLRNIEELRESMGSASADRTLLLGGDCSSDLAPIARHLSVHGAELVVVYFDAHADINQPSESPSGALHGMVLRHLLGDGDPELCAILDARLMPTQIRYRGVREYDPAETELIERLGITTEPISATSPSGPIYIHLDLDVLDPNEFALTTYPTPGGPSVVELAQAVDALIQTGQVVGIAITECAAQDESQLAPLDPLLQVVSRYAGSP